MIYSKPVIVAVGLSICGITSYLIYKFLAKDEDDDYKTPFIKASGFKTLEIKVAKELMKELIGRNGKNIKSIQENSGTKISFKDIEENGKKVCVVRGSIEACYIAEKMIQDFIDNQPVLVTEHMFIPKVATGKVIGRGGQTIMEIQSNSGAKVFIHSEEEDLTMSNTKIIFKGTSEQISLAKFLVTEQVKSVKETNSKLESTLAKREPRQPSKLDKFKRKQGVQTDRLSPALSQQESPFEVYVSAMCDPSRFWIQIVGPKATQLDQLVEEMTEYYSKEENKDAHKISERISKGDLVAAVFKYDNKWYRAEVLNVSRNASNNIEEAELYYVDYGDTDSVPTLEILELGTDFLQLHFQAIECYLANVEPVDGGWSEEAVDKFEEWAHVAQWKKLSAKIKGYSLKESRRAGCEDSSVPGVDLFDCGDEKDINIAEELVKHGFAVFKEEQDFGSSTNSVNG